MRSPWRTGGPGAAAAFAATKGHPGRNFFNFTLGTELNKYLHCAGGLGAAAGVAAAEGHPGGWQPRRLRAPQRRGALSPLPLDPRFLQTACSPAQQQPLSSGEVHRRVQQSQLLQAVPGVQTCLSAALASGYSSWAHGASPLFGLVCITCEMLNRQSSPCRWCWRTARRGATDRAGQTTLARRRRRGIATPRVRLSVEDRAITAQLFTCSVASKASMYTMS